MPGAVRFVKRKVRDWVRGAVRWWLWVVSWARVEGERGGRVEGRVRVRVVARVRGRERRGRLRRRVGRCMVVWCRCIGCSGCRYRVEVKLGLMGD